VIVMARATHSRQWLDEHDMACWWCGAEARAGVCAELHENFDIRSAVRRGYVTGLRVAMKFPSPTHRVAVDDSYHKVLARLHLSGAVHGGGSPPTCRNQGG